MADNISAWMKRHALVVYFILAYAISWAIQLPLATSAQGWLQLPVRFAVHYLAAFEPMLAVLIVISITEGQDGVRQLLAGLSKWRVGIGWFLFSTLLPIGLFGVAVLVGDAENGTWPDLSLLGEVDYLPYLGIFGALLLWLLTFGLGEEIGWRGYALPRLQKHHNALTATLMLGVVWTFWHLPAFFYKDTYMAMGMLAGLPLLLLSILAASIVFTWLYNSTNGSLLIVTLFHALFDFLSVSRAGGESAAAIMSAAVMIWALLIAILFKPANLSRKPKVIH
ncbi:MAG TPA: type II CAAX endopeptidase family protein [Anaerolineales bacterium]|nr:type II CAAX endopeptidase family protein [Anaerolineales bacterium]